MAGKVDTHLREPSRSLHLPLVRLYEINSALCIDLRHVMTIAVLIGGFFSGGCVFLMTSFLQVEPAYLCSYTPDYASNFTCSPHKKEGVTLQNFCEISPDILVHKIDYSKAISLNNWFV